MKQHCCRSMTEHLEYSDDDEVLIWYFPDRNEYGLPDRKRADAYTPILFCPWCGSRLPSSFPGPPVEPFEKHT